MPGVARRPRRRPRSQPCTACTHPPTRPPSPLVSPPLYSYPVNSTNMNYACVMLGGTMLLSAIAWIVSARKWFKGPVRNVDNGNKTETLAEAAMRGELDEDEGSFGESGEAAAKVKGDADEQFVTGA